MSKPSRNDPCPCGSGKKYKKCCLQRDEVARPRSIFPDQEERFIAESRPDVDDAVDRLLERVERGEGRKVESEIRALFQKHPRDHMTNYAMGVYTLVVLKDPASAVAFFETAVEIFPSFAEAHFNLGSSAQLAMDIPKAVAAFQAAVRYAEDDAIGTMAREKLQTLEGIVLKGTSFKTLDAYLANARLFDRAFQCLVDRKFNQAAKWFQRVLAENPNHVQSHGNLGLAYAGLGDRSAALACFDRAVELDPKYEPALRNRRVISQIPEGEPLLPTAIEEVHFYSDQFRNRRV